MKTKFLSAHIDGTTGKVVALTESGCYLYERLLSEEQTKKLMKMLETAKEIDTKHWELEWELKKLGSQDKLNKDTIMLQKKDKDVLDMDATKQQVGV